MIARRQVAAQVGKGFIHLLRAEKLVGQAVPPGRRLSGFVGLSRIFAAPRPEEGTPGGASLPPVRSSDELIPVAAA